MPFVPITAAWTTLFRVDWRFLTLWKVDGMLLAIHHAVIKLNYSVSGLLERVWYYNYCTPIAVCLVQSVMHVIKMSVEECSRNARSIVDITGYLNDGFDLGVLACLKSSHITASYSYCSPL